MFGKKQCIAGFCLSACLLTANGFAQNGISYEPEDRSGIKQDLLYLMGYQMIATGIIYYLPEEFSGWSEEEKSALGFQQWKENIQNPVWDSDHWAINYVLHPYWGAGYYIRGRERGFSKADSFWISMLFSTIYEFGFEAILEEPSIQDLIVTPVAGSALGYYFEMIRYRINNKVEPLSLENRLILGLTDPLGALNRKVNSWFGVNSEQQPKAFVGLRFLRSGIGLSEQTCRNPRLECGQKINGAAITLKYRW